MMFVWCVCVCVYICVCVCVVSVSVSVSVSVCMCTCVCKCKFVCACAHYTCCARVVHVLCVHLHVYVRACARIYMRVRASMVCAPVRAYEMRSIPFFVFFVLDKQHSLKNFSVSNTPHCNARQRTATQCNALQRTATHCNALQHTATHCNTLQHSCRCQNGSATLGTQTRTCQCCS